MNKTDAEDTFERIQRFLRELENSEEFTDEHQVAASRHRRRLDDVVDFVRKLRT
jgi:hypothetical protein